MSDDLDEDERKKRPDVEPFAEGFSGAGAPTDSGFTSSVATAVSPAASPQSVAVSPIEGLTLDRCLIYGIYQSGMEGLFTARDLGIKSEHLDPPENLIYEQFEKFVPKTRLPTRIEILATTAVDVVVPTDPFDVETFGKKIVTRALRKKLKDGLQPIIYEDLVKDPAAARDSLAKLVVDTAWSTGQASSYTDPSTAQAVYDDYLKAKNRGGGLLGVSSPWPNVDKHSLGLQEGELTVILAKRKMGKSWMLLKWMLHALHTDLKAGENLLIVSMEMPVSLCYRRLAAIDLKLAYKDFRGGTLTGPEEKKLEDWVEAAKQVDPSKPTIHVIGPNTVRDVSDIAAKAAEYRPRCVAIDGFYILGRGKGMMWERTIENVSQIKLDLCAGLSLPVLATTQFKGSKGRSELQVDADDAAYAKAIGDWADAMRALVADSEMDGNRQRLFVGMESREFRPVDILINFDLDVMNFDEIKISTPDEFAGAGGPGKKGKKNDTVQPPGAPPTIIAGTLPAEDPTLVDPTTF